MAKTASNNKSLMKNDHMKIKYVEAQKLVPYAQNARLHTAANITTIAQSIATFGFNTPVLVDDNYNIIAGHGRVLAAEQLGIKNIPVVKLSHLSSSQKKAYIIADNKIAENSTWDQKILDSELEQLLSADIELETIGFSDLKQDKDKNKNEADKWNDENCEMPIVPDFFEQHDCFIIVVHNEIDSNFVRETLGLTANFKSRSKDKKIRKSNVIDVESLRRLWAK